MKFSSLSLVALALSSTTSALIGYPTSMFNPSCAFACRDIFSSAILGCSGHDHASGAHSHGQGATSPERYASDTPWLATLANCINSTCTEIAPWKLEKYWSERVTGTLTDVQPKRTYQETLVQIERSGRPSTLLRQNEMLDFTATFDEEMWELTRGTLEFFENVERTHSRHGIILLVVSFATPILVTCISHFPYMTSILVTLKSRLVWPSLVRTYHVLRSAVSARARKGMGTRWELDVEAFSW